MAAVAPFTKPKRLTPFLEPIRILPRSFREFELYGAAFRNSLPGAINFNSAPIDAKLFQNMEIIEGRRRKKSYGRTSVTTINN
jgi:hypothetical protein